MSVAPTTVELRHDLLERLSEARFQTDRLFGILRPDSLYERPIPERHRIVFYIGHLEAFDWNLLSGRILSLKPFHAEFDNLFAFGIDPVGGGLPTDQPADWPAISEVKRYVQKVRSTLDEGLERVLSGPAAGYEFSPSLLLNVAIEHRLMHAETLAYMFHQLPFDHKIPQAQTPSPQQHSYQPQMIEIPAGPATLGLRRNEQTFGWDNEYEQQTVDVPTFAIDKFMVSNGEYLEFVNTGGYDDRSLWTDADWQWRTTQEISHPVFWTRSNDQWFWRGMFEATPLPLDWPVYVSQAEASAYARWAGKALPTEAQWHRAAYGSNHREREYPWGEQYPAAKLGNFDFQRWEPAPVGGYLAGDSAFGISGLLGNGWEWTSTEFGPFPGFEPFPFYRGYSAAFFDGKHYVMKGGSPLTAACMLRSSFRNWFQSHYQYVYAGFRCVSN